jgi:hypothetical protein
MGCARGGHGRSRGVGRSNGARSCPVRPVVAVRAPPPAARAAARRRRRQNGCPVTASCCSWAPSSLASSSFLQGKRCWPFLAPLRSASRLRCERRALSRGARDRHRHRRAHCSSCPALSQQPNSKRLSEPRARAVHSSLLRSAGTATRYTESDARPPRLLLPRVSTAPSAAFSQLQTGGSLPRTPGTGFVVAASLPGLLATPPLLWALTLARRADGGAL